MNRTVVIATAAIATVLLAGCSAAPIQNSHDAPGLEEVQTSASYYGVETFCNHGNRVYVTSNGGIAVAPGSC